jgi:excisionase family DNA binding protein
VNPRRQIEPLLTSGEVADLFGVSFKTVQRWHKIGKLRGIRTPGGHRRFRKADVLALRYPPAVIDHDDGGDDADEVF